MWYVATVVERLLLNLHNYNNVWNFQHQYALFYSHKLEVLKTQVFWLNCKGYGLIYMWNLGHRFRQHSLSGPNNYRTLYIFLIHLGLMTCLILYVFYFPLAPCLSTTTMWYHTLPCHFWCLPPNHLNLIMPHESQCGIDVYLVCHYCILRWPTIHVHIPLLYSEMVYHPWLSI